MLTYKPHHWTPQGIHGVIPMPDQVDIKVAVNEALKKLVPNGSRFSTENIDYTIHTDSSGQKFIVFELK